MYYNQKKKQKNYISGGYMKIMKIILLLAVVFTTLIACEKEDENSFVFAVDSTWPPMEFIDTDKNEIVGFSIDLIKAIAEKEGFEAKFLTTAWDGIFAGLLIGDYHAISSSVTITEERKKSMLFSDPYFEAGQILAVRKENANEITSLEDLSDREVGAQIGTQGAAVIEKSNAILKAYQDLGPAAEELANGTIDGIVADTPLVANYLLQNKKYKNLFTTVGGQITSEEYGFAFPLDCTELKDRINAGLKKVKADGTYDAIYQKWIQ